VQQGILGSLSLVDASGYVIIAAILTTLVASVVTNLFIRGRYAELERDLEEHTRPDRPFSHRVLNRILEDARGAASRQGRTANFQAIVEHRFQSEFGGLLIGERFVRASVGLVIILGLVGTFYGLSLSIGKLVTLVASDDTTLGDATLAMMQGLTRALSGMSVAFTASLFGIASAILLTLFGIFFNLSDRRTAVMIATEAHLEQLLGAGAELTGHGELDARAPAARTGQLQNVVDGFAHSVVGLENAIGQFQEALETFATTTRDFREFNLHLKDNVQRMSLCFGDLSEALKTQIGALRGREPR